MVVTPEQLLSSIDLSCYPAYEVTLLATPSAHTLLQTGRTCGALTIALDWLSVEPGRDWLCKDSRLRMYSMLRTTVSGNKGLVIVMAELSERLANTSVPQAFPPFEEITVPL